MDRNSLLKFSLFAVLALLFFQFGLPKLTGGDGPRVQPIVSSLAQERRAEPDAETCTLKGPRFSARLSADGAAIRELYVDGAKYTRDGAAGSPPMNLVTTPAHEAWHPLAFEWSSTANEKQVVPRFFDWKVTQSSDTECVFTYTDERVELRKVVRSVGRPFELEVEASVKNVGTERAAHRASVSTVAWRTEKEIAGGFGRQSPMLTQVECVQDKKVFDKHPADFEPKDFAGPEFQGGWLRPPGSNVAFAATTNFYFAQALVPVEGPSAAMCELQIEDFWDDKHYKSKKDAADADPNTGSVYKSRLAWAPKELGPGESTTYKVLHFMGPKEREVLASATGMPGGLSDMIQLGTFAIIAKVLVGYLLLCFSFTKSWGLSIILLTLTVRAVMFPLTWKQIQSGLKMRLLKPEIDAINKKYGEDAQQKQLAIMELHKKNGISVAAGCLPALVQMPVWFALYSTVQTAAELYHVPFLWFRDLSAPDTFWFSGHEVPFILPLLLGSTTFIQQKIMPQQMDPMQQKMMTYMLPAIFTAMMLFLPSGLGVYMFTNSVLGILQQLVVERYYASKQGGSGGGGGSIAVREKDSASRDRDEKRGAVDLALGKGEAGV